MIVLGLDTCLNACSVAVIDDGAVLAHASEVMARGHQERLAPMTAAVMAAAGIGFDRLERIGATVGPGSFTGLRVGVAFAKGLAAALQIPAVGVGTLEAMAAGVDGLVFPVIDARRGQVYVQGFESGRPLMAAEALPVETAAARLVHLAMERPVTLTGSGAPLLADVVAAAKILPAEGADARHVAGLAATGAPAPLRPLYLRAPDARLPA